MFFKQNLKHFGPALKNQEDCHLLTSLLVPELMKFKYLKNNLKRGIEVWVQSVLSYHRHLAEVNFNVL